MNRASLTGCENTQRQSQVYSQIENLNHLISVLEEGLTDLKGKLCMVLVEIHPKEQKEPSGTVNESMVPLAMDIREMGYRIESLNKTTKDVINRLEL